MCYSVLMSVYYKENPIYLEQSMKSIYSQTIPTDDFVLVCDGPLTDELNRVIGDMQKQFKDKLHVIRLPHNRGLGNALNEGIKYCKHELVARMDSDDISYPNRCEKQLHVFKKKLEISICSGTVEEFSDSMEKVDVKRILPENYEEILEFAKRRNPFNHPCVMYKKSHVEAVGSYQDFYLLEDYYLWVRMLLCGYKGYNIQEPLLYMRAGSDMYNRRAGWKYAKSQISLFRYMMENNFIGRIQYIFNVLIRCSSSIAPNWLRKYMFKTFVRR